MADLELTEDAFLGGRLVVAQPAKAYRAGLDAVLLAASCRAEPGQRVMDAGAGVGVVGLALATRAPAVDVVLVERSPALAGLARRNVERNGLAARVRVVEADVLASVRGDTSGLAAETFDHVLANPPYQETGRGRTPPDRLKAEANEMPKDGLELWVRFLARMAAPDGTATMIHRADALRHVLDAFDGRFGALEIVPIHPRATAPANRVLVSGRKGSRAPLRILPQVTLHGDGSRFLPGIEAVLREGAALPVFA